MNCFKYRNCWIVAGMLSFLPILVQGQTHAGSVTIKGGVSEIVALSLGQTLSQPKIRIDAQGDLKTLTLTLSGSATDVAEVRVPILIRSNTGYDISALVRSQAATVSRFVVLDARPIGRFVAADALASLKLAGEVDRRATKEKVLSTALNSLPVHLSSPSTILSGSRISLSGTLNSMDNALEVTILIVVKPDVDATNWVLDLSFSASADQF